MTNHTKYQFEVFPHCIGDKLLFQTGKGITIEINNLNISIIINNDRIVNKTHLIRHSLYNRINIKITARHYTTKLLHFVFKSHLTVHLHILVGKKYIPGMTLNINNTEHDSFSTNVVSSPGGKGDGLKSVPPAVN